MKKKQPNTRHGRAAIYARYSSHNQREASIEQQVKACRELAVRLGLDVVETYEDKAISGKSDRRPSFQRLLRMRKKVILTACWRGSPTVWAAICCRP